MAATASENLQAFVDGIAKSLAESSPEANRLTSRTEDTGESETYQSTGEQISALKRALELSEILDSKANKRSYFRPIKLTRN